MSSEWNKTFQTTNYPSCGSCGSASQPDEAVFEANVQSLFLFVYNGPIQ